MPKVIFVTYGNKPYYNSLKRITKEAEDSEKFDTVLSLTDKDLPTEITSNVLFQYNRGGGYWLWKPWVVLQALSIADENDIVVYSDCGNTISSHKGWEKLFNKLNNADGLFFYNGDRMESRTRRETLHHFGGGQILKNSYQIISSIFLIRKNKDSYNLVNDWYAAMRMHPNIVMDVAPEHVYLESKKFIEHRHDQAVLSCIVYSARKKGGRFLVLPEQSERLRKSGQPIYNSRISDELRRSASVHAPVHKLLIRDLAVVPFRMICTWILRKI